MYIPIWFAVVVLVIWITYDYVKKKEKTNSESEINNKPNLVTEEVLFKIEQNFEQKYSEYLPNNISGRDIYIYMNLMKPCFYKLVAKFRYDDDMIQKLRSDWLDYIRSLSDSGTYGYLAMENNDESDEFRSQEIFASKNKLAIEDAFAIYLGLEVISELKRMRELSIFDFNNRGEIAPEGFAWNAEHELVVKEVVKEY